MTPQHDIVHPGGPLIRELFSADALDALEAAADSAKLTGWETIRTPHIFLGILGRPDRVVRKWAFHLGADLRRMTKQFRRMFRRSNAVEIAPRWHREFLSQNALEVLRTARRRCESGGRDVVTQADLLWAVFACDCCVSSCFAESGVAAPVLRVILAEAERVGDSSKRSS